MRKNAVVVRPTEPQRSYNSQCGDKKKYTKRDALTAAKGVAKSGRREKMSVYQCPFCNYWHLSHYRDD